MAGHGSNRPLDTASDPSRSGLPGIQPGDAAAGIGGFAIDSLSNAFQKGLQGPGGMMPELPGMGGAGAGEAAGGAEAAGGLAELAPLLAL